MFSAAISITITTISTLVKERMFYLKCDHPEGDTPWSTCPWIISEYIEGGIIHGVIQEGTSRTVAKCTTCPNDTDGIQ